MDDDDILLAWAGGGGPRPVPIPAAPPRPWEAQCAAVLPPAAVVAPARLPGGDLVMVLPDVPVMPLGGASSDPYQRFLDGLPELLPDLTGGRAPGAYPEDTNLRGGPRGGMTDDQFRQHVVQVYGPDAAAYVTAPYDKFRAGDAPAEEKAAWSEGRR